MILVVEAIGKRASSFCLKITFPEPASISTAARALTPVSATGREASPAGITTEPLWSGDSPAAVGTPSLARGTTGKKTPATVKNKSTVAIVANAARRSRV
jgi:hypothetical protein